MSTIKHFKRTRVAAMVLASLASTGAMAIDSYAGDPGKLGDPASWRTAEFMRDWGVNALGAEYAYALGFSGAGVKVGLVDSGFYVPHPDLPSSRFHPVEVNGIPGGQNPAYNDSHGTHVSGTVGASRDGGTATANMQGVAFNANVYMGNTHKTDGVLYGIPQTTQTVPQTIENGYVADVYRAVNAQGVRIIGTSFGSQPNTEQYQTLQPTTGTGLTGRAGLAGAWAYLKGADTWFQGALDAAKTGTIIAFSAGNGGYANPSPRAAAAYFDPTLEKNWLAVAAIRQSGQTLNADGSVNVPGTQLYNQCGVAKWSCVTAPGNAINSTTVSNVQGGGQTATYASQSGTSMAQPHATGALAVIMERFSYMTNEQVLDVMKTTAVQNATINDAAGIAVANPNAGKIVVAPDDRNGWGTVSLKNAMNGPGQFTGRFAVNTQGQSDTWSNNISDTAIRGRKAEDDAEAVTWAATKVTKGWTNGLPAGASVNDASDYATGVARETARNTREYTGSLAKFGAGAITLTGNNSFSGGTELYAGKLVGASKTAFGTGNVSAFGGTLAIRGVDTVAIAGNLSLGGSSMLDLMLDSGTDALLSVTKHATFGGLLALSFDDSFTFAAGLYDLVDATNYDGMFSSYSFTGLDGGFKASVLYTADGVKLQVAAIPEPETYALMLAGLGLMAFVARRRKQA
ncbi:MAG: outer rane autotransporter barrel domain protein [Rhizobacter sp.]|nr:outer rane autotransporter barrel domain protein [Rhizobacter sp.]